MKYLDYLIDKLAASSTDNIIESAVNYLGGHLPENSEDQKPFEIVDHWLNSIQTKWNVEIVNINVANSAFAGKLIAKRGGFIINLNKNLFTTKKRLTVAHELAHTLSFDTNKDWPEYKVFHSKTEESYCSSIARAILLPTSLVDLSHINGSNLSIDNVAFIKKIWPEFHVSPWQIIKKILEDQNKKEIIAVYWEFKPLEGCLRVIDKHQTNNIFIPLRDRKLIDNLLVQISENEAPKIALNSNTLFQADDLINLGSIYKKKLFTTAFPIITTAGKYVIQLINLKASS